MQSILVSSCLLGENCKYNKGNNKNEAVIALKEKYNIISACPECLGGLENPREPSEIKNDSVISKSGIDVTDKFNIGAKKTLELATKNNCIFAVLKAKSPSCGSGQIYDGTFSGKLIIGDGITTRMLKANGIKVINEMELK